MRAEMVLQLQVQVQLQGGGERFGLSCLVLFFA
jgi:hypothetical protein